ncbi:MAG: hypothetical protein OXI01_04620 [Albidovulum sp.]|nr:hypothetical protein [Albidovulum sp.]
MWKFFKSGRSRVCALCLFLLGLPSMQHDVTEWKSKFCMIPESVQWILFGAGIMLFFVRACFTIEANWPKIMRWPRIAKVCTYRDKRGAMHFGTIHGD